MEHTMDFTKGPIVGPLLKFSMPILFALFLQALYGAVDLMVVGKFALAQDVSGVRWRRMSPASRSAHKSCTR